MSCKEKIVKYFKKFNVYIQLFFIVFSLIGLVRTDSLYSVYIICSTLGIVGLFYNNFVKAPILIKRKTVIYLITSVVFALCVIFANCRLFFNIKGVVSLATSLLSLIITLIGTVCVGMNILLMIDAYSFNENTNNNKYKLSLQKTLIICFFLIIIVDVANLFLFNYPGILSPDSISQMNQLLSCQYGNHHPFYHTIIIKICVSFGLMIFGEINAAVACYSIFQIILMAAIFTFCISTLYQIKAPKIWIILSFCFYALMPYHISYSFTMWKDIPFGGAVLLLVTSLFRIFNGIGKSKTINWITLIIGALGTCLWRSNGWIAFLLMLVVFFICYFKQYKLVGITFSIILIVTYVMIHPVLSMLNINQPDTIESLSIPAQQIAKVVTKNGNVSEKEYELLNKIIDTDKIAEEYNPGLSDPIKHLVRATDNQRYLEEHKFEYLKLWITIGIKNPINYITAWIDQTKGYWNGGYDYWIESEGVYENDLGIQKLNKRILGIPNVYSAFVTTFNSYNCFDFLRSIGLCTWIFIACGSIGLANKREKNAFLVVPILAIIATLCIATPVFSEFRYAYALFTCVPLILCTTFYKKGEKNNG